MKSLYNKITITFIAFLAMGTSSCDNEDYLVFTAAEPSENIMLLNDLESAYKISEQTSSNIAELHHHHPLHVDVAGLRAAGWLL